jgi:hypothetical protein
MRRDMLELQTNWKTRREYEEYFTITNGMPRMTSTDKSIKEVLMTRFPEKFFDIAINSFDSNFDRWQTDNLQLALGGDNIPAMHLANWILGQPSLPLASYESFTHDTTIRLDDMMADMTELRSPEEMKIWRFFLLHGDAVERMSKRESVWKEDSSLKEFREFIESKWLRLPSNTQFVEEGVKDSKRCASTAQNEQMRSTIATQWSYIVHSIHDKPQDI